MLKWYELTARVKENEREREREREITWMDDCYIDIGGWMDG